MGTNELYEKVRTAPIGARIEHDGKTGIVEFDPIGDCGGCMFLREHGRCEAAKLQDSCWRLPCMYFQHEAGRTIVVRELKEGESC